MTELAAVATGALGTRRYVLYVSETQRQADDHVHTVARRLESVLFADLYDEMASRAVSQYGHSLGWRRNRLLTESDFVVDAIGLDVARRGAKLRDVRPDFIIFDDLDARHDGPDLVQRKIATLTDSILPAGSDDVAILGVQNLVQPEGIFARLAGIAEEPADFLVDRVPTRVIPAVWDLEVEQSPDGVRIVGGEPSWDGQDLEACQREVDNIGFSAFRREMQHEVDAAGGIFEHLDYQRIDWPELPDLVRTTVWVDPAVTAHDGSDAVGIQADALGADGRIYRLYSFERVITPEEALRRAILKAKELRAGSVGIETDQGGDTWKSVFRETARVLIEEGQLQESEIPELHSAKAGAGHGSKVERASRMLADYERGQVVHVRGTHGLLERCLGRFPLRKPFDLVDASYWSWAFLRRGKIERPLPENFGRLRPRRGRLGTAW